MKIMTVAATEVHQSAKNCIVENCDHDYIRTVHPIDLKFLQ